MTRRFKRHRAFDLELSIKVDEFIRPPRDSQRNWLLNRAIAEFTDDLVALDAHAHHFVSGSEFISTDDRTQAVLSDEQIMEDWQIPLMRAMALAACEQHGSVLEIGFGRGVAATFIQDCGAQSHTVIECNDSVVERFETWRNEYPGRDIHLVHGLWQDTLPDLGKFDGLLFHTYPLNEADFIEQIAESTTFAEHFFAHAAVHLNPGGAFTYLSNEIDSLSRSHQRALLRHFSSFRVSQQPLNLPHDVHDAWWANSMALVTAFR